MGTSYSRINSGTEIQFRTANIGVTEASRSSDLRGIGQPSIRTPSTITASQIWTDATEERHLTATPEACLSGRCGVRCHSTPAQTLVEAGSQWLARSLGRLLRRSLGQYPLEVCLHLRSRRAVRPLASVECLHRVR